MGKRVWVGVGATALVALIVVGVVVSPTVAQEVRELTADPCQPEDPRLLEAEVVHQHRPPGAAAAGPASVEQPCEGEDHSVTSGRHSVEYTSTLSDDSIRRHYEAVARDSGWHLKPDPSSDKFRLVYGEKWVRDRCLDLSIDPWRASVGEAGSNAGDYTVHITFWPRHNRSFCDE